MIHNKWLRLPIQFFNADTGAAAGGTTTAAAPGDTGTAAAGDQDAAGGGTTQSAVGDTTTGGGDTKPDSTLSKEDLQRYQESDFLKALGYDSIDAAKAALKAAKELETAKPAGDKTQATDEQPGDKKDAKPGDDKTGEKTGDGAGDKAGETKPGDEADQKPEPTIEEKELEIADLKAQLAATKAGVKEESLDDVLDLAKALSKRGKGMEIDAAIKAVVEKYPSFAGVAEQATDTKTPRFGEIGSHRTADDSDPFVRSLLGK